ncbi:hypothetical protein GGS21DRAFT_503546 [Xylaria nigripes]|nr:hypothetical protein GGS21DRAFT_503546 [Xylaria nigripes]
MHPEKSSSFRQYMPSTPKTEDDKMQETKPEQSFMRKLFRSNTIHHPLPPSPQSPQPQRKPSITAPVSWNTGSRDPKTSSQEHRGRSTHKTAPKPGTAKPASVPPARNAMIGTRGYFVPPYRSAEHFSQSRRPTNPTRPLPLKRARDASRVTVGFYHCQHFNFGSQYLSSPDLARLLSAAVAFLGECQLHDTPQALQPARPNAGYRGLSLEGEHGYHLHFPDCAGARPFSGVVEVDWARVTRVHARDAPGTVLLVGVGAGRPGEKCC